MGLKQRDIGNNETIVTGYTKYDWGYTAFTHAESRSHFKTERGAIAWLAKRGYNADGTRKS
jgi:hypothetical protein